MKGEKIVQLIIDIPDEDVLLSDFDLFHYVLNYWYLPLDQNDEDDFEEEYAWSGYNLHALKDVKIQTEKIMPLRLAIEKSWDRIFDLEREDNNLIYGLNSKKSIQATFWQLKREQVKKAEVFIAK